MIVIIIWDTSKTPAEQNGVRSQIPTPDLPERAIVVGLPPKQEYHK
jgi:hypothetical protein